MASSMDTRSTRYVMGGTTEVFDNRLGWWERKILPFQDDDIIVTLDLRLAGRPDLISTAIYGTPAYMWLVLQYNTILDPLEELKPGVTIRLPSQTRLV